MSIPQIKFTTQAALASKWRDAWHHMLASNLPDPLVGKETSRQLAERSLNEYFSAVEKAMEDGE